MEDSFILQMPQIIIQDTEATTNNWLVLRHNPEMFSKREDIVQPPANASFWDVLKNALQLKSNLMP